MTSAEEQAGKIAERILAARKLDLIQKVELAAENCTHCREIWNNLLVHIKAHEAAGRFGVAVDAA